MREGEKGLFLAFLLLALCLVTPFFALAAEQPAQSAEGCAQPSALSASARRLLWVSSGEAHLRAGSAAERGARAALPAALLRFAPLPPRQGFVRSLRREGTTARRAKAPPLALYLGGHAPPKASL
ncbi:MAG: hypothetical protein LBD02_03240 [Christensenellaceae bacterium]|jgi:hypothetical protein|nr:hypothetical protein [Christensenellaceae bacterium]